MRTTVIIATSGRPIDVTRLLKELDKQAVPPTGVIISAERCEDVPLDIDPKIDVIYGPRGASSQRNRGLEKALPHCEIVVFVDDDYIPSVSFIADIESLFECHPQVAGATGLVLADGVTKGGLDPQRARALNEGFDARRQTLEMYDIEHAYGCNMAFRTSAIKDLRFDEALPLYSWQEDVDFGARVAKIGRMVKTNAFAGVHLGVIGGRTSGKRLGYSQIANPVYLLRKGTMRFSHAVKLVTKNILANHLKAFRPEAHVDRLGRLFGNWLAIRDVVFRRDDPRNILQL